MTLAELKAKYKIESATYEPKPDCRHCKGVGERPIKSRPTEMTFCICLFVSHEASDDIGTSLGQHAKRQLEAMRRGIGAATLTIVIGATIGASAAHATPPHVIRYNYAPPVVPVLAAYYQPIPLVVPQYSVGTHQQLDLTPLIEELKLLRATVQQLKHGGELADLPPEPEYVGLVRQHCASCHGINPKGNKLSFFHPDGRWKEPSPELLGTLIAQVSSGAMPKGQKMDAADRLKLIAGLTSAPPEAAKMPGAK